MTFTLESVWLAVGAIPLALFMFGCVEDGDVLDQESDAAETGAPSDTCTGLDQAACEQESREQNCVAIWGTPYVQNTDGGWCVFSNGVQYLGCREASACTAAPNGNTICAATADDPSAVWQIGWDCLPVEVDAEVCEPPSQQAPFC
jgi:hypothetical protein